MPRSTVLSISSQVAYGHVGNSATIVALQTQACDVIDIPTIIMSSHPGHGTAASIEISAKKIDEFLSVLSAQGRLDKVDAILSGYLRSPEQVIIVRRAVELVKRKNPAALYCCDPVIGDESPGIYVPQPVAEAIKAELIPVSDIITPNLFEFQFLIDREVCDSADCIEQVRKHFKMPVLLTSAPMEESTQCGTLLICPDEAWACTNRRIDTVPNGTGDLLTGLFVGRYLSTRSYEKALSYACGQLNSVLIKSVAEGGDELALSPLMTGSSARNFPPAQPL